MSDERPTRGDYGTPQHTPSSPNPATPDPVLPSVNNQIVTPSRPPRLPRHAPRPPRVSVPSTPAPGALSNPSSPVNPHTPGDASIVNPTPIPLTPGTHRRELGVSPVRLTPRSSQASPSGNSPTSHVENGGQTEMVVWGTTINIDDAETRLRIFLSSFALDRSQPVQTPFPDDAIAPTPPPSSSPYYMDLLQHLFETGGTVLNIDMCHLYQADRGMYRKVLSYPNELITVLDAVAEKLFSDSFQEEGVAIREKRRKGIQTRTYNLLPSHVQSMRDLNPKHISTLVAIRGMVIRVSNIIPDIQRAMYRCTKCSSMTDVMISYGRIDEPRKCNSCNTRDSFSLIHSRSTFSDKQMVRLQEAPEAIPKGDTPATFTLVMYDTLVDFVKPGDRVEITGILRATPVRVNPKLRVVRSVFRTYIDCVHVRVLNNNQARRVADSRQRARDMEASDEANETVFDAYTDEQKEAKREFFESLSCHPKLYERLANSLAPSIFGMMDEKKGVLLQLFGGANKSGVGQHRYDLPSDGSARFRSALNILLIGDPGTSKSQLLHSAHRLAPRGVYTSGRGSSAVGLTAYVTKDPDSDDYVLESGALVLSDRGICCIDEFDKMSDYARSVLHEAMEQQTVSIAKAGIIATLNARTAVLAAANPVNSRYDTSRSVVENIDLPPTLLSRFDLIYLVLDAPNADTDRKLAQHIVSLFYKNYDEDLGIGGGNTSIATGNEREGIADGEDNTLAADAPQYGDLMDAGTLTEYIAYSREKVEPRISDSAAEALVEGYLDMRSGGRGGGNITATPRQLESLIRLAEAHARMQLKEEVDESDVDEAMRLVKSAMHMAAYDPLTGKIDMNLFAAGKSRAADNNLELLCKAITEKLHEQGDRQEMGTMRLLSALRSSSDVDISAGDLRNALRRLEEMEQVVTMSGGSMVRLV